MSTKNRVYEAFFLLTLLALGISSYETDTIVIDDESTSILSQGEVETASDNNSDPCYEPLTGKAQHCLPNFENIAYNRRVVASSTCGSPPLTYCLHNGIGSRSIHTNMNCDKCDESSPRDAKYLTDLEKTNATCWVSGPVYQPDRFSNLTLDISFGKKYEITYIR